MRQKSLVAATAAALLAGTVFASAQGMQKQAPGGGGMERGAQQGQEHQPGAAQNKGEVGRGQHDRSHAQRQQKEPSATTGQGQQSEPNAQKSEPSGRRGEQGKEPKEPRTSGQSQQGSPKADREQEKRAPNAREGEHKNEPRTQGQHTGAGGAVTLTTEQRTKVRDTVIRGGNAPRVNKVDFSISVGTAVPRSVKIVTVPTVIVDIHPEWRGYLYFVYEDEVIIVDHNNHIVAILDV